MTDNNLNQKELFDKIIEISANTMVSIEQLASRTKNIELDNCKIKEALFGTTNESGICEQMREIAREQKKIIDEIEKADTDKQIKSLEDKNTFLLEKLNETKPQVKWLWFMVATLFLYVINASLKAIPLIAP